MNKKKKSTNTSPYPDEVIERLARAFYPAILACWNSEEGQREFAAWQAEQAHLSGKEKQSVPDGERPVVHIAIVCGFFRVRPGGRKISINCTGVEDALDVTIAQRFELDYLIYNDPLAYAELILNGEPEKYLRNLAGSHGLED